MGEITKKMSKEALGPFKIMRSRRRGETNNGDWEGMPSEEEETKQRWVLETKWEDFQKRGSNQLCQMLPLSYGLRMDWWTQESVGLWCLQFPESRDSWETGSSKMPVRKIPRWRSVIKSCQATIWSEEGNSPIALKNSLLRKLREG